MESNAKRYTRINNTDEINDIEVLYDYKGTPYQISDVYYDKQLKRRRAPLQRAKKAKQLIDGGFSMLTPQQGKVMTLVVQGLTMRHIADIMSISYQRVGQLKKAAVRRLRNYIPTIKESKGE